MGNKGATLVIIPLLGITLNSITAKVQDREVVFKGEHYEVKFFHDQGSDEIAFVKDIYGEINDLIGSPILLAEVLEEFDLDGDESLIFTFYKFATAKGYVTIVWSGDFDEDCFGEMSMATRLKLNEKWGDWNNLRENDFILSTSEAESIAEIKRLESYLFGMRANKNRLETLRKLLPAIKDMTDKANSTQG